MGACGYFPLNDFSGKMKIKIKIGIVILSALITAICFFDKNQSQNDFLVLEKRIKIGDAYASSSINVPIFRQSAIITTSAGKFCAYYDKNGNIRVSLIQPSGEISSFNIESKLPQNLLGDGHCTVSMGYTDDNNIHLVWGAHATKPRYFYFAASRENVDWLAQNPPVPEEWQDFITYPQFYNAEKTSLLFYRVDADIYVKEYERNSKQWKLKYGGPLLTADGADSVYIDKLAIDGNFIRLSWVYRIASESDLVLNDGIYSIHSDDGGQTWRKSDEEAYNLPIKRGDVAKFVEIPENIGIINQNASFVKNELYCLSVLKQSETTGLFQIYLYIFSKDRLLCLREISNNKYDFPLRGRGTLSLALSRPSVAISEKNIHVIYRQNKTATIASVAIGGACADDWSYYHLPDLLGNWEPNFDPLAWSNDRTLAIYIQSARQGANDKMVAGPPAKAYLYEIKER